MTQVVMCGQFRGARGSRSPLARPLAVVFRGVGWSLRSLASDGRSFRTAIHRQPPGAKPPAPRRISPQRLNPIAALGGVKLSAVTIRLATSSHAPFRAVRAAMFWCPPGRISVFHFFDMQEDRKTIGLGELLDQITADLDELRRKHPGDYAMKNITMWWELEKERLVTRHSPASVVRRYRNPWRIRGWTIMFLAGCLMMLATNIAISLFRA